MGTSKRERQKANRALKREQQMRQERVTSLLRRVVRIALGVAAALIAVVVIAWVGGAFDDDDTGTVATETTVPGESDDSGEPAGDGPTENGDDAGGDAAEGGATPCPPADGSAEQRREFAQPPPMCLDDGVDYSAVVSTNLGEYTIELDAEQAPLTVNNFVVLARYRYFDGTECHRIIPDFVVQCGDPTGTGTGGPGYRFADELPAEGAYELGSVAMANSGPDTNGSQFFVISGPQGEELPPNFSLFGQVTEGLDTIAALDAAGTPGGDPSETVRIESVEIVES